MLFMLSSRTGGAWRATKSAVCPRCAFRSFRALRSRVSRESSTTGTAGSAIVAVLPGLAHKARRSVGTGIALRTHRAWLTCWAELAIMTRSPRGTR